MAGFFDSGLGIFVLILAQCLLVTVVILVSLAFLMYGDRKVWAAMQLRRGPNVVGPVGILQPFADGLKLFLKETIVPSGANKGVFFIAPMITFVLALVAWAVIPFDAGWVLADINVGLLFLFAVSSMGVYGIIMSGWASNSKYPFLGGLRSAAQMVSYEVSIGFVIITVVLYASSFNLTAIVESQRGNIFGLLNGNIFQSLAVFDGDRVPDLGIGGDQPAAVRPARSRGRAGCRVSGGIFQHDVRPVLSGRISNILLMCALTSSLFLGGYLPPLNWAPLYMVPGIIWLFLKVVFMFFVFAWVKATVPRYRYDQLMRLGWKIFLPLSLFWVALVRMSWLVFSGHYGAVS